MRTRALLAAAAILLAGCVSGTKHVVTVPGTTSTRTITETPSYSIGRDRAVAPLSPGAKPARGESERRCPYIASSPDGANGGSPNVADIVGSHVYRTTVLTRLHPVGCRFYFYAPPYEAIADIVPRMLPTARDARNVLVLTARRGSELISKPSFARGVDGIAYRTAFVHGDGRRDWAFAFAKGRVLVVVHTQRSDPASLIAVLLGKAIVNKF